MLAHRTLQPAGRFACYSRGGARPRLVRRTESLKFRAVSSAIDLVPGTAGGAVRQGKSTGRSRGSSVVRRAIHRILDKPTQLLATDYGSCYPPCVAEEGMPSIVGRIFSIVPCNSKFFICTATLRCQVCAVLCTLTLKGR